MDQEWKKKHPEKVREQKKKNYEEGRKYNYNSDLRWTPREIRRILNPKGRSDRELARKLFRSVQAIQVKRTRVKKQVLVSEGS